MQNDTQSRGFDRLWLLGISSWGLILFLNWGDILMKVAMLQLVLKRSCLISSSNVGKSGGLGFSYEYKTGKMFSDLIFKASMLIHSSVPHFPLSLSFTRLQQFSAFPTMTGLYQAAAVLCIPYYHWALPGYSSTLHSLLSLSFTRLQQCSAFHNITKLYLCIPYYH